MATIRKRMWRTASGKRQTRWQVTFHDNLGRRKAKQFATLEEARKWLETTDLRSIDNSPKGKTVADATQAWVDRAEANELERSTVIDYQRGKRVINQYIGSVPLSELTMDQVIKFKKELANDKSPATARRTLHILKMALNHAVDEGWAVRNVARRLRSAKSSRHQKALRKKINVPTRAELRAMVAVLEQRVVALWEKRKRAAAEPDPKKAKKMMDVRNMAERARPMFMLLFETGVRPSELRGLAWPQVDFDRGTIEILQRVDQWNTMGDCKTDASYRKIPVSNHLLKKLREWRQICPPSELDLVFPTANGSPISLRNLQREYELLQLAAGVFNVVVKPDGAKVRRKKYTLKESRHGAASWWIHKKINLKDLTTRIGHSSIQVTFDVYGHLIEEAKDAARRESSLDDDLYRGATSV